MKLILDWFAEEMKQKGHKTWRCKKNKLCRAVLWLESDSTLEDIVTGKGGVTWGDCRLHVPCGLVADVGPGEVLRVDVKREVNGIRTNATHTFDARLAENYPAEWAEKFDFILIDPPYSQELAESLYDTGEVFGNVGRFARAALPSLKPGGIIATLSYATYPRLEGCNLVASWGIYQAIAVSYWRGLSVWIKDGERGPQGLEKWSACGGICLGDDE